MSGIVLSAGNIALKALKKIPHGIYILVRERRNIVSKHSLLVSVGNSAVENIKTG